MSASDLHALDRAQLLREVELRAQRDSHANPAVANEGTAGPVHREIDRWADQRVARIDAAQATAEHAARDRVRAAESALAVAEERRARAEEDAAAADARKAEVAAVLLGERRGTDGGDWSDESRTDEHLGRRKAVDATIYGSAAVAEVSLNYLAFQLMGADRFETAALAAAVVLVAVLLPKQLGALLTTARRTRQVRGWPLAVMIGAGLLWLAVSVFTALVRTAYLLLPTGSGVARPALLAAAGLGRWPLTAGWLAVALAVGLTVLLRSSHRHNPYAKAWHRASTRATATTNDRSRRRAEAEQAAESLARAQEDLRSTASAFGPLVAECRSLAAELKLRYGHELGSRRTATEQVTAAPRTPAIEPGAGGTP